MKISDKLFAANIDWWNDYVERNGMECNTSELELSLYDSGDCHELFEQTYSKPIKVLTPLNKSPRFRMLLPKPDSSEILNNWFETKSKVIKLLQSEEDNREIPIQKFLEAKMSQPSPRTMAFYIEAQLFGNFVIGIESRIQLPK